jgi:hypothetical protein
MKQPSACVQSVTSDETPPITLAKLRQSLGEAFVAALADSATIGMLLSADGTLWQEQLRGPERWRLIETMNATRAEAVLRAVTAIASDRVLKVQYRLDGSHIVGQPLGLNCACCRPKPLQAAPDPLFRLCWRKICMIRSCLKNAEREELRALNN